MQWKNEYDDIFDALISLAVIERLQIAKLLDDDSAKHMSIDIERNLDAHFQDIVNMHSIERAEEIFEYLMKKAVSLCLERWKSVI